MTRRSLLVIITAGALSAGLLPTSAFAAGPTAVDDHLSVPVNSPATTLQVLSNDTGGPTGIQSATPPSHGTVAIAVDGQSLIYQPSAAFHGTDTFDYGITGGDDVATVVVDVNSAPVAVNDPGSTCFPLTGFGGSYPVLEDQVGSQAPTDQTILTGPCGLLHNDTDLDKRRPDLRDRRSAGAWHGIPIHRRPCRVQGRPQLQHAAR